jgi:hypothetical protein
MKTAKPFVLALAGALGLSPAVAQPAAPDKVAVKSLAQIKVGDPTTVNCTDAVAIGFAQAKQHGI